VHKGRGWFAAEAGTIAVDLSTLLWDRTPDQPLLSVDVFLSRSVA